MITHIYSRRYLKKITLLTVTLLLILCFIFIAILSITNYDTTKYRIANSEYQRTENLLSQTDDYMNQLFSTCKTFAALNIPYSELTTAANFEQHTLFNKMLSSYSAINSYIANIELKKGSSTVQPSGILHERKLDDFLIYSLLTEDTISWPYYFDLTSNYGQNFNTVTITVSAYHLSNAIFSYNNEEQLYFFLTEDGTVLLTNQKKAFFLNINDLYPGIFSEDFTTSTDELHSYDNYYCIYSKPNDNGFRMLSLVPRQSFSYLFTSLVHQTVLMSCVLILVTLLLSFILAHKFFKPIEEMITLLRTYIPDDLKEYENEIAYIKANITKYIGNKNIAATPFQQTLSEIHSAQTAVMQNQINNHFLFNTLENIKAVSITELGIDNEIENSIILLNTIIREGILQKTSIVPLSEELRLVECYLELMQMRFSDVEYSLSIDDSLLHCPVFKFSLQPILENCYSHAFINSTQLLKRIHIHAFREENDMVISIQDNGDGFDEQSIINLKQYLDSDAEFEEPHHVGIRNVHKRITNVFGHAYGITITNTPPGTTVSIRYPITVQK